MHTRSGAPRAPGVLELAVYRAVAAAGPRGATAAEVRAEIHPSPAHSTVVTTLRRLLTRGVLAHHTVGRTAFYVSIGHSSAVTATATATRMHRVLAAAPDPDRALAEFVAGLPPAEAKVLGPATQSPRSPAAGSTPRPGI